MRNVSTDPSKERFERAIASIDAVNAEDPNRIEVAGTEGAKEILHARLATRWVKRLVDEPGEALLLATRAPVLLAPAMNTEMWHKKSVQRNVRQLREDGVQFIEPESGWLSCGQVGAGRMSEPADILHKICEVLAQD